MAFNTSGTGPRSTPLGTGPLGAGTTGLYTRGTAGAGAPVDQPTDDQWPWQIEVAEDQWPEILESGPVVANVVVVSSQPPDDPWPHSIENEEGQWPDLLESAPVGANAILGQPPDDAWNWTADDVDLVVIPGGYPQPYIPETPIGDEDDIHWWDATDDGWWDYLGETPPAVVVVADQPSQTDWIDDWVEDDWGADGAVDPGDMPAQLEWGWDEETEPGLFPGARQQQDQPAQPRDHEWDWDGHDVQQTIVPTDQQAENEPPHPQDHDWFDDQLDDPWPDWLNADDLRENAVAAADQPTQEDPQDETAEDAWPEYLDAATGADAADQPLAADWQDEDAEDETWLFQTETFAEQLDRQQFDEADWDVEVSDDLTSDFPTTNEDSPQDEWPWFEEVEDWVPDDAQVGDDQTTLQQDDWPWLNEPEEDPSPHQDDQVGANEPDRPVEAAWLDEEVDDWQPADDSIGADATGQADQPPEAAWLEEEADDWAPENDQVGADAINGLLEDAWLWEEVEDALPADDQIGADSVSDQPPQDEWDWAQEVEDDFVEAFAIDDGSTPADQWLEEDEVEDWRPEQEPIGADAVVDLASAEAWEWALEQEDDQRTNDEPVGADEPPLFVDAWPWESADDTDDWWPEEAVVGQDQPPLFVDAWTWESADDTDDPPPADEPIGADEPPLFVDGWYWDEEPAGDDDWWTECQYQLEDQQQGLTYTQDWDWVEDDTSDDDWWQSRQDPQIDNVDMCPIELAAALARIAELERLLAEANARTSGGGGEGEDYFRTRYRWATRDERIRRNNALILALVGAVVHGLDKPEEPTK